MFREDLMANIELDKRLQEIIDTKYEHLKGDENSVNLLLNALEHVDEDELAEEFVFFAKISAVRILRDKQDQKFMCVALATNKRVIEFNLNPGGGFDLESIDYVRIASTEYKEGIFTDEIKLHSSGNSLKIQKIVKGNTLEFYRFIKQKIDSKSETHQGQNVNSSAEVFTNLEKLSELKDKGIITSAEFEEKKREWLKSL